MRTWSPVTLWISQPFSATFWLLVLVMVTVSSSRSRREMVTGYAAIVDTSVPAAFTRPAESPLLFQMNLRARTCGTREKQHRGRQTV